MWEHTQWLAAGSGADPAQNTTQKRSDRRWHTWRDAVHHAVDALSHSFALRRPEASLQSHGQPAAWQAQFCHPPPHTYTRPSTHKHTNTTIQIPSSQ